MTSALFFIQIYQSKYGDNYLEMLNFDENNNLLRILGINRYPTVLNVDRPVRWEFKLDYADEKEEI